MRTFRKTVSDLMPYLTSMLKVQEESAEYPCDAYAKARREHAARWTRHLISQISCFHGGMEVSADIYDGYVWFNIGDEEFGPIVVYCWACMFVSE
jgi:hypothetical protein